MMGFEGGSGGGTRPSLDWFLRHRMLSVHHRMHGLAQLIEQIAHACVTIHEHVARCAPEGAERSQGRLNQSGDRVCELDGIADDILVTQLGEGGFCAGLVSEERALPEAFSTSDAPYLVAIDPLDGSSNLGCAAPVGTIFSIRPRGPHDPADPASYLGRGDEQVVAGYAIYGSSLELVLATAEAGVCVFSLGGEGRWRLRHEDVRVPQRGRIYSVNEANVVRWRPELRGWLEAFKKEGYTQRYVGSLVADVHRTLFKGGVFLYPGDATAPQGKLRLLYEAAPIARVFEVAGALATDGARRLLELEPTSIHERTPVVLGGRYEVMSVERALAGATGAFDAPGRRWPCSFDLEGQRVRGHLEVSATGQPHQFHSCRGPGV